MISKLAAQPSIIHGCLEKDPTHISSFFVMLHGSKQLKPTSFPCHHGYEKMANKGRTSAASPLIASMATLETWAIVRWGGPQHGESFVG